MALDGWVYKEEGEEVVGRGRAGGGGGGGGGGGRGGGGGAAIEMAPEVSKANWEEILILVVSDEYLCFNISALTASSSACRA